jgi:aspartate aminotransferase
MTLSSFIQAALADSEPVTAMFRKLSRGPDARTPVFNFAIGQPSLWHTPAIQSALDRIIGDPQTRFHPYPATSGLSEARAAVAALVNRCHGRGVTADDVMLTVGAAGALHVIFRTLLNPGDEVVTPAPFFLEYKYYCENYGARLVVAESDELGALQASSIAAALSPKTKLVLLNSPNNPAGTSYGRAELAELHQLLATFRREQGRELIVVSDETYHRVYYGDCPPPSPWAELRDSILVGSFSKDLGLAGERVGYLALSPELRRHGFSEALALSQRVLGFMNAPLIWQRVLPLCLAETVDNSEYRRKRDSLAEVMIAAGLDFALPDSGMFILARSPIEDDRIFVEILARHGVIVLPGRLYGAKGFVRASFSVDDDTIRDSLRAWQAAVYEALDGMDSAHLTYVR